MKKILFSILFPLALMGSVWASTVDDVITLSNSGVGNDVLLAYVDHNSVGRLSADDIAKLKAAGVPDSVIVEMLQKNGGTEAAQTMVAASENTTESSTPSETVAYDS